MIWNRVSQVIGHFYFDFVFEIVKINVIPFDCKKIRFKFTPLKENMHGM